MDELGVPSEYVISQRKDYLIAAVHKSWLKALVHTRRVTDFVTHDSLVADEVKILLHQGEDLGPHWQKILVKVLVKTSKKVIPPPRCRSVNTQQIEPQHLSFAHLLHYVSQTNHKNLWKESYKKYSNTSILSDRKLGPHIALANYDVVMRDIILRTYGCPLINIETNSSDSAPETKSTGNQYEVHFNILPAYCTVESRTHFFIIHSYVDFNLQDCVTFSPAVLTTSHAKPLFVIYQLLQAMRSMHDRGLVLGDLTVNDILISQNLWIQIIPRLEDNIHDPPKLDTNSPSQQKSSFISSPIYPSPSNILVSLEPQEIMTSQHNSPGTLNAPSNQMCDNELQIPMSDARSSLVRLCDLWVRGGITNFDYLTVLNEFAGRRFGDPTSHHVMPWVTDFAHPAGGNWRDLSKSKFRINKGDRQLDLTYDAAAATAQVPHHVSDVLSEITYYVYAARRTPTPVLCKYVRTRWVPAEYPHSIQRLQEWTPDECIPEFFTDPNIFKSIHDDLEDLQLPPWAPTPQDFIRRHREALESAHVSERLHQWIDLTFGFKLSGLAAVKAKNVCLQLADSHVGLSKTGVVQLFTQPHPQRASPSPFWGKTPPRLSRQQRGKAKADRNSDDEELSSGFEEEDVSVSVAQSQARSSSLAFSRLLSRSRGSLLSPLTSTSEDVAKSGTEPKPVKEAQIPLPKDYNPAAALNAIESLHGFVGKTFHRAISAADPSPGVSASYRQVVAARRIRETRVLGCLAVEIFLASKLRPLGSYVAASSFDDRLDACHAVLSRFADGLPRCVKHAVALLLQFDSLVEDADAGDEARRRASGTGFRYPTVSSQGLPPPSAHQLLQPLLSSSVFPFPKHFPRLYTFLAKIHEYSSLSLELDLVWPRDIETETRRSLLISKIAESKITTASKELVPMLPEILAASPESLEIVLPYMKALLEEPATSILAAWELFDPVAKVLGPQKTTSTLLESILKLYDCDASNVDKTAPEKHAKLYHRSFILKLVVRFGLKTFLENFTTPLVEAVGGYKDSYDYHASLLKSCNMEDGTQDCDGVLSPLDEGSSGESEIRSEREAAAAAAAEKKREDEETDTEVEPGVFVFETEPEESKASPTAETPLYSLMDHLGLNLQIQAGVEIDDNVASVDLQTEIDEANSVFAEDNDVVAMQNSPPGDARLSSKRAYRSLDGGVDKRADEASSVRYAGFSQRDEKTKKESAQCKVSDMSIDSLVWLSHRLGPVLTARHLSRNLLRMLTLCYLGRENLTPLWFDASADAADNRSLCVANGRVVGDENAGKVLDCLASFAALYGEQIVLVQYLPHMSELTALCKKKLTANLEGGLVGCLALLKHIVPYLSDATLMDQLQDVILKTILHPAVRIISTGRFCFPSGPAARSAAVGKYLDATYVIALRIGCEMTRTHLAVPSLQRFFLAFDRAFEQDDTAAHSLRERDDPAAVAAAASAGSNCNYAEARRGRESPAAPPMESNYVEIRRDGTVAEWAVKGMQISHVRVKEVGSADSYSPPPPMVGAGGIGDHDQLRNKAATELKQVFNAELAHLAYLPFYRFLGDAVMEQSLKNHEFVQHLCCEFEVDMQATNPSRGPIDVFYLSDYLTIDSRHVVDKDGCGSFGSNVAVVGNRIDLQRVDLPSVQPIHAGSPAHSDVMALITRKMENTSRHLHGNWLAYWEHEIGRAEKDSRFNFKQIKLQTFAGHTNGVRTIQTLDNENSFLSGGRDKTVKLWSLRSQGDGSSVSHCRWTYAGHRKSVLALAFLESLRLAASCDSVVHLWDPFMGCVVGQLPPDRPVNVLRAMPPPAATLLAATTDATLRTIDARTCSYVNELKVSHSPAGLIRCIATSPGGHWACVGQSSGYLTLLDLRTGGVVNAWRGHEGEVLQLVAAADNTVVSSSLDQSVSAWGAADGKLAFHMKGPTEPVHCMAAYGSELISGTTANRIGVHTAVSAQASFSSTRLRSDTFRGVLTAMAVLPLNRLLLLGADSGNISLLC